MTTSSTGPVTATPRAPLRDLSPFSYLPQISGQRDGVLPNPE